MKKLLIVICYFLFCGAKLFSQIYVPQVPTVYGVNELRHKAWYAEHIPEKEDTLTNTNDTTAQIFLLKADSSVWAYYKPRGFFQIGSGGGGGFALDSIYVYGLIDTNMTLHPGHVSIFVEPKILDSLKHQFIDTASGMTDGYVLTWDDPDRKWVLAPGGGGSQTLQQVFNVESRRSILTNDDTIDVVSNALHLVGNGIVDALMLNGSQGSGFSVVGNSLTLSHQDNTGASIVSAFVATSNRSRLITQQGADLMDLSVYKDSLELKNNTISIFKAFRSDGHISFPQYNDAGNFYDTNPVFGAGFNAAGDLVQTPIPALVLETDGNINAVQNQLNLVAGTNITLTDDGSGSVTVDAAGTVATIANLRYPGNVTGSTTTFNASSLNYSVYNVKDWTLVNDSSTDNTAAFRTLLTLVPDGAAIYFPGGGVGTGYLFSDSIVIKKSVHIYGDGQSYAPVTYAGMTNSPLHAATNLYFTSATKNFLIIDTSLTNRSPYVTVNDINVQSTATATAGASIVLKSNITGADIRNISVKYFYNGINSISSNVLRITNCNILGNVQDGIIIGNSLEPDYGGYFIEGGTIQSGLNSTVSARGVYIKGGGGVYVHDVGFNALAPLVQNTHFIYDIYSDFSNGATSETHIYDNSFNNFQTTAIKLANVSGFDIGQTIIANNHFAGANTSYAIDINHFTNLTIANTVAKSSVSTTAVIKIDSLTTGSISNTTLIGTYTGAYTVSDVSTVVNGLTAPTGSTLVYSASSNNTAAMGRVSNTNASGSNGTFTGLSFQTSAGSGNGVVTVGGIQETNGTNASSFFVQTRSSGGTFADAIRASSSQVISFPHYTNNLGLLYTDGSGVVSQVATPGHTGMRPYYNGSSIIWTDTSAAGSGSVTSVATGLGLSGGTITTTGMLLVDTSSASILSRQRAATTYWSVLGNDPNAGTAFLGTTTNKSLRFQTNGTQKMVLDSTGVVTIGAAPTGLALDVQQTNTTGYSATANNAATIRTLNSNSSGGAEYSGIKMQASGGSGNAVGQIYAMQESASTNATAMVFTTRNSGGSYAENIRINSTGNVNLSNLLCVSCAAMNTVPNSTVQVAGNLALPVVNKTNSYTAATDYTITVDATTKSDTITLPSAISVSGRIYNIKKIDPTSNFVSIFTTSSQKIDSAASYILSGQNSSVQLQADGANWIILADNSAGYLSSAIASGSAVSLTTATSANVTSITLTQGDWDVEGNINYAGTSATVTGEISGISSTSATVPTDGTEVYSGNQTIVLTVTDGSAISKKRFSVTSATTVYLVGKATFSAGTVAAFGSITARRIR